MASPQRFIVQGLEYETPPVPDLSKIRNSSEPKEDQVWIRNAAYLRWDWNVSPEDEDGRKTPLWHEVANKAQLKWYEEEIYRLNYGDWIMINGEPTYFNKYAYFYHQWFVLLEGIYPIYKETSLEYFRFFELCEKNPLVLGECGIKGRRLGLSSMNASIKLLIGLLEKNTIQGIVSKTGTDAQEMYFMVKNGLENLPEFIMPELNKVTDSEIHIAKPSKKISAKNTRASGDKGMNNRINWLDTAENAYDGRGLRHVTLDEAAKMERTNVQILFSKISDTLVKGAVVKGHISVFSTVNKGDKGGENFKRLWEGSNHIDGKKDKFGRTETKLCRFFIPGYRGYMGYIGKYGESIIDTPTPEQTEYLKTWIDPETKELGCPDPTIGAKEWLMEERKMKAHDPELYAEQVRKYPFEWPEVFKDANNQCHFNLEDLNNQIERVEAALEKTGAREYGRRGRWKADSNGDAVWVDDPAGLCYVIKFLPKEQANKTALRGSITCPDNTIFGAAGMDTYANARATVEKGSDACLLVFERYNPLDPENSGMPVAMLLGRPKTKGEYHHQVYLMLRYYGIKMLAERSPTDWEDHAIEKRLASELNSLGKKHGYLITTMLSDKKEAYGIATQDKMAREVHLTEMIEYALNNMHKIWFLRILKDMVSFNIKDRTDFDGAMAFGYALMAVRAHLEPQAPKESNTQVIRTYQLQSA